MNDDSSIHDSRFKCVYRIDIGQWYVGTDWYKSSILMILTQVNHQHAIYTHKTIMNVIKSLNSLNISIYRYKNEQ